MKTTAVLRLKLSDGSARGNLVSVLAPDNQELPKGLDLSVRWVGREAEFVVESDSTSTSVSTVLALLRDIELFQEVWLLSRSRVAGTAGPEKD